MTPKHHQRDVHGYLAEYQSADALVSGVRDIVDSGYRRLEAFTPFPVEELDAVMPPPRNRIPLYMLLGASVGAIGGYWLQHWTAVFDYPWLVGGKPMLSWPAFGPVIFELAVLCGAITGFLAMLWSSGLPQLHHPVFEAADFDLASRDRFFLLVEVTDDQSDAAGIQRALEATDPHHVHAVPRADAG